MDDLSQRKWTVVKGLLLAVVLVLAYRAPEEEAFRSSGADYPL
jgi:hypothetical protein